MFYSIEYVTADQSEHLSMRKQWTAWR